MSTTSRSLITGMLAGAGIAAASTLAALGRRDRQAPRTWTPQPSGFEGLAEALSAVAAASQAQAESMGRLAVLSAESVRMASGSYVFELRDRFDLALPVGAVGVSETAVSAESDLGPFEFLVFQPGDRIRADVRIAVSQSPVRRIVSAHWEHLPERCDARPPAFAASSGSPVAGGSWELPSDVSLFVDLVIDLDVGSLAPGAFESKGRLVIEMTDTRPEGAVATYPVDVRLALILVPDEDGVGVDVPLVDAVVGQEQRTYLLEKATGLPLELPKLT